ncbi:hypothetical protein EXIGLDRAFT_655739 [Exidia glandulosa HHB12029]|uniref:NAD(P)-binding domain-containing protein n=1 Tax=Exidia glandulosa HHB12029 TaxID=1314781 RepID=A0A165ZLH5_EXIGL|nr:hypothetical protein EXIGLDRAFT_655739 [Exidia glandulosa HHB12029]
MHLILTGATGLVGHAVLQHCLASPAITQLSILSRRDFPLPELPPSANGTKARVIVHGDFTRYDDPGLVESLRGAEGCVWAQGVSSNDVSKEEYVKITHDYPMAAAKAFAPLSDKFNFVYVSGEGADPTEKSFTYFGKIKGRAEAHLLSLPSTSPSLRVYNVRPGFVDPGSNGWHRNESFLRTSVMAPLWRVTMPASLISPTEELAKVLVDLASGDGRAVKEGKGVEAEGRTLRSSVIRRWGEVWGTATEGEAKHTEL